MGVVKDQSANDWGGIEQITGFQWFD